VMQSYSNFTVGGSISVNAHGRYQDRGALVSTVRALQLISADGKVHELSRTGQPELFAAVIGGYGLLGVITEVELELTENEKIERVVREVALEDYPQLFAKELSNARLHNADIIAPVFDRLVAVSWMRSDIDLTEQQRLVPDNMTYSKAQNEIWAASEFPLDAWAREQRIEAIRKPAVVWRNYEASLDVDALEPRTRKMSTYLLQEYFVPEKRLVDFVRAAERILKKHAANVLNISIRHATADTETLMSYTPQHSFCLVFYYKQRNRARADQDSQRWALELIDAALSMGGSYYLPYRLYASVEQFRRAYPNYARLLTLKDRLDPQRRFRNAWFDRYLT
jgi:FAD/FMN-containing dehydrogenase